MSSGDALKPDYSLEDPLSPSSREESMDSGVSSQQQPPSCTSCTTTDSTAVAHCFSCSSLLCASCVIAHHLMIAFEGHSVTSLGQGPAPEKRDDLHQADWPM